MYLVFIASLRYLLANGWPVPADCPGPPKGGSLLTLDGENHKQRKGGFYVLLSRKRDGQWGAELAVMRVMTEDSDGTRVGHKLKLPPDEREKQKETWQCWSEQDKERFLKQWMYLNVLHANR